MTKQTPHKRAADNIVLILAAVLILIVAMSTISCSSERRGCSMRKGFVGYENR